MADRPTGIVTLTDNNKSLDAGTYNLNSSGYLEDQPIQLGAGQHTLQASYAGDNSFYASASAPAAVAVNQAQTTVSFSYSLPNNIIPSAVPLGSSVTMSAIVNTSSNGNSPSGMVTFFTGNTAVGSVPAVGSINPVTRAVQSTAALTTTQLPYGLNILSAQYVGDMNYATSSSQIQQIDVQIPTAIQVTSSLPTVAQGTPVTFTARITPTQNGGPAVTGNVLFTTNTGFFFPPGQTPVVNGQAQAAINGSPPFLPTGSLTVSAQFTGDNNYGASAGGPAMETVNPQPGTDFTLSNPGPNPSSVTIAAPGDSTQAVVVTVTPINGFTGSVNFPPNSCSISPAGSLSTCAVTTFPITGSGSSSVEIKTTAPSSASQFPGGTANRFNWSISFGAAMLTLILLLAFPPRQRSWSAALGLTVCILLAAAFIGCGGGAGGNIEGAGGGGGGGSPGTPIGVVYTVTVTGTCGPLNHSASFTFIVQ